MRVVLRRLRFSPFVRLVVVHLSEHFRSKAAEFEYVMGIETSCDETSCAIVRHGREVLSNVIASQAELHRKYGGVVPEIASRKHVEYILPVLEEALEKAGVTLADLSGVAVTVGPGLVGALLVGVSGAKALAFSLGIPLVGVNHVEGHIYANFLAHPGLEPPLVCLTVSGGHTDLVYMDDYGSFEVLGRTTDDAAGEAFDKVGRVMGLPYPAGPEIDRLARGGNRTRYELPRAYMDPENLSFSFSGLKTAVINLLHNAEQTGHEIVMPDLAASFQWAVVDVLVTKAIAAVKQMGARRLAVSGGVSANSMLRTEMERAAGDAGIEVFFPPLSLCTDNAAMIACAGYYRLMKGQRAGLELNAHPGLGLGQEIPAHATKRG